MLEQGLVVLDASVGVNLTLLLQLLTKLAVDRSVSERIASLLKIKICGALEDELVLACGVLLFPQRCLQRFSALS